MVMAGGVFGLVAERGERMVPFFGESWIWVFFINLIEFNLIFKA